MRRDVMNDTVATEDLEQPAKCHERKARYPDRDPGCRTSSRPAEICSAQTGRTYDRSRPNRSKRQKSACQGRPSTYGTSGNAHKTAIIGDDFVGAVFAARDMPAESRRAATLDRRHDLQLAKAHMAGVGLAPRRSMVAEDIRDFQIWPPHDPGHAGGLASPDCSGVRRSSGLMTSRMVLAAMRV